MRFVLVQRSFHPNTYGWVEGLRERGHEVHVVIRGNDAAVRPDRDDVSFVRDHEAMTRLVTRLFGSDDLAKLAVPRPVKLWRELRLLDPDVVLVKDRGVRTVFASIMAGCLRIGRISWHNAPPGDPRTWRLLRRMGVVPRRAIHTTTSSSALDAVAGDALSRFIPYAIPLPPEEGTPRDTNAALRILTVADFKSERKRPWWTLEAALRAGLMDGTVDLTFVGTGDEHSPGAQRIREILAAHDVDDPAVTVRFHVHHALMDELYRQHDVLVLPSRDEPFGMVVLEAMAHGLAVVVSDTVASRCFVVPGETGFVFDTDDVDDLAEELRTLARERGSAAMMGRRGRELVANVASPERCAAEIEALATAP